MSRGFSDVKAFEELPDKRAWEAVFGPHRVPKRDLDLLFERGLEHFKAESEGNHTAAIIDAADRFATESLQLRPDRLDVRRDPWVDVQQPGRLALVGAAASVFTQRNDRLRGRRENIIAHEHIRRTLGHHFVQSIYTADCRTHLHRYIGDVLFGREREDEMGPAYAEEIAPNGFRVLEDGNPYLEVPLTHASKRCLVYEEELPDSYRGKMKANSGGLPPEEQLPEPAAPAEDRESFGVLSTDRTVLSVIRDDCIYIPGGAYLYKLDQHFEDRGGMIHLLENHFRSHFPEDRLDSLAAEAERLDDEIERVIAAGRKDRLLERPRQPAKLRVLVNAVRTVGSVEINNEEVVTTLDDPLEAAKIEQALAEYLKTDAASEWEQAVGGEIDGTLGIGKILSSLDDHPDVDVLDDQKTNQYVLSDYRNDIKRIDVTEIEDLLELPCMASVHERANSESPPPREVLYTFVRRIMDDAAGFTDQDIVEWFSQYPWFRRSVTEYQVEYERRQGKAPPGQRPLPIGCQNSNTHWSRHCIGTERCEYSVYRSSELKDEVWEALEAQQRGR